ncbi:MAG: tRNA 2-thiocytidine(32) synthetase TtcA [Clostridiales bacterium]|nr:tRNA 2-thiocytidine(32) synthetase TtcA [Clostridiales bacterium]
MRIVLGCAKRAIEEFNMIEDGEKICVGVSGGKDSLALLKALSLYRRLSPVKYDLHGIMLTMGFGDVDTTDIEAFCKKIDVPLTIKHTRIGKIVFEERNESNPCSLCARMRRGALHNIALELGSKKLALGHHREDVIETLLLSMLYEGRIRTFSPVTYLDRKDITVIRPLIYAPEARIIDVIKRLEFPILKNPCPADGHTKRHDMKDLIEQIIHMVPNAKEQMLSALRNVEQYRLWD